MHKDESILVDGFKHIKYHQHNISEKEMRVNSETYLNNISKRRSVRNFSNKVFSIEIIENL